MVGVPLSNEASYILVFRSRNTMKADGLVGPVKRTRRVRHNRNRVE